MTKTQTSSDLEPLVVRFQVDRHSLNEYLGNTSKASLRSAMTEFLGHLFGTVSSYCGRCGSGTSEETGVRGHFEVLGPDASAKGKSVADAQAKRITELENALHLAEAFADAVDNDEGHGYHSHGVMRDAQVAFRVAVKQTKSSNSHAEQQQDRR